MEYEKEVPNMYRQVDEIVPDIEGEVTEEVETPAEVDYDPCDRCTRNICYGCPHIEG